MVKKLLCCALFIVFLFTSYSFVLGSDLNKRPLASSIIGTVGIANGGTGTSTAFTQGSVVFAGASGIYSENNSNLFFNSAATRLGIGTASPLVALHLAITQNGPTDAKVTNSSTGAAAQSRIILENNVGTAIFGMTGSGVAAPNSNIVFFDAAVSPFTIQTLNVERLRILTTGEVGIGTSIPATTLDVAGTVNATNFSVANSLSITAVPASNLTVSGISLTLTAGETLAFGDIVYIKSDGKMWKGDADVTGNYPAQFMAAAAIVTNNSGVFLLEGIARNDSWTWTVGGSLYLSTTAGSITQTAPSATDNAVQILGFATHANRIYFKPSVDYLTHI